MLTTLTIPHRTLGQLHTRDEMKILLAMQDGKLLNGEHVYAVIPQPPSALHRLVKACLNRLHTRVARA